MGFAEVVVFDVVEGGGFVGGENLGVAVGEGAVVDVEK